MSGVVADLELLRSAPSGAVFSDDGRYRYVLWRKWGPSVQSVVFVMLNPSTADATEDDATIRRCIGFARRCEADGLIVLNQFALRATDPRALRDRYRDVRGPDNFDWWRAILPHSPVVIAAWGGSLPSPNCARDPREYGASEVHCLGRTKAGHPRHPLYLPSETPLEVW